MSSITHGPTHGTSISVDFSSPEPLKRKIHEKIDECVNVTAPIAEKVLQNGVNGSVTYSKPFAKASLKEMTKDNNFLFKKVANKSIDKGVDYAAAKFQQESTKIAHTSIANTSACAKPILHTSADIAVDFTASRATWFQQQSIKHN